MTKADVVQLLGWRLGDRDDMAARIDAELPFIQEQVLEAQPWCPWFLLTEEATASTTVGERRVPLPEDFLMEAEESHLYITLVHGDIPLVKMDFDSALAKYPGEGTPVAYAIQGRNLCLFPVPGEVWPITMNFYGRDVSIRDDSANSLWLKYAGDLVLAELGKVIAGKHIKDANAAAAFALDAQTAWNRLYHKHVAMTELNIERGMNKEY